jgi:hypothetical protein
MQLKAVFLALIEFHFIFFLICKNFSSWRRKKENKRKVAEREEKNILK